MKASKGGRPAGVNMHHIGEVGDKISFRNVIVTDLQNLGIKVSKPRRKSGSHIGKVSYGRYCIFVPGGFSARDYGMAAVCSL